MAKQKNNPEPSADRKPARGVDMSTSMGGNTTSSTLSTTPPPSLKSG